MIKNYYGEIEWDQYFQRKVEEFAVKSEKVFVDIFSKIYEGFEEMLELFQSRPNIWLRENLLSFCRENQIFVIKKEDDEIIQGESLVFLLQRLGFLGLGTRKVTSDRSPYSYSIRYSFLERQPSRKPWEIAVLTPMFYDSHNIIPFNDQPVVPHQVLLLSSQDFRKLSAYDHYHNVYRENGISSNR